MKMKTTDLTGPALDWAVAKCGFIKGTANSLITPEVKAYSTDWAQGGPIIEQERILVQPEIGKEGCGNAWNAVSMRDTEAYGPTALVAAMRAYVASKMGDEVEVPDELTQGE